jgi:hypothetical protein
MHQLRCILAAFFAILIAVPACCCASALPEKAPAKHSCCEGGKKEKHECACDCEAKTPRNHEGKSIALDAPVSIPPEPVLQAPAIPAVGPVVQVMELPEEIDTGPPRWRLAMLQRLLI